MDNTSSRRELAMRMFGMCLAVFLAGCVDPRAVAYVAGRNVEDLVAVPGAEWIVGGGIGGVDRGGALHLFHSSDMTSIVLFPEATPRIRHDAEAYPQCPGPVDAQRFMAHGVNISHGANDVHTLYAVNHGAREAIEVFELDARAPLPHVTWIGCVPLPAGSSANGVAPLASGGIVATFLTVETYFDGPVDMMAAFESGRPTGHAARWTVNDGWSVIRGTEGSGPNGVETSPDGRWIWVAHFGDRSVVRVPANGDRGIAKIEMDMLPDNLRWGDDGQLWVAGPLEDYFSCSATPGCKQGYAIARIDPDTLAVVAQRHPDAGPNFHFATTALRVGSRLWLGSNPGEEVVVIPVVD